MALFLVHLVSCRKIKENERKDVAEMLLHHDLVVVRKMHAEKVCLKSFSLIVKLKATMSGLEASFLPLLWS